MQRVTWSGLRVAQELSDFLELEAMRGTGVQAGGFWHEFAGIVRDLVPRNRALLARREALQAQMFGEMRGRIKEDDSSLPSPDGPFDYYARY